MTAVAGLSPSRVIVLRFIPFGVEPSNRSDDVGVAAVFRERDLHAGARYFTCFEVNEFVAMRNDHGWMANEGLLRSRMLQFPWKYSKLVNYDSAVGVHADLADVT